MSTGHHAISIAKATVLVCLAQPLLLLIDVDFYQPTQQSKKHTTTLVPEGPTAWITDSIVNAVNRAWHWPGEILHILYTSQDHWLTVSTIGVEPPKLKVYNRPFDFLHMHR